MDLNQYAIKIDAHAYKLVWLILGTVLEAHNPTLPIILFDNLEIQFSPISMSASNNTIILPFAFLKIVFHP